MADAFDPFDPDEWGDKPECSAFETALDMRARGACCSRAGWLMVMRPGSAMGIARGERGLSLA